MQLYPYAATMALDRFQISENAGRNKSWTSCTKTTWRHTHILQGLVIDVMFQDEYFSTGNETRKRMRIWVNGENYTEKQTTELAMGE